MRNGIIGIVIGLVVGVVVGATVIAPGLAPVIPGTEIGEAIGEETPRPGAAAVVANAAAPPLRWKMGSGFAGSLPQLGTLARRFDRELWQISGGDMEIKFHEPGTLVPVGEMLEAVASGAIDAAFSSPAWWADRAPALRLFSSVPFGPAAGEYLAWIYFGGGRKLFEEIYHRRGVHGVFCGIIAPEAAGWFRKEIRTVDDLKGLRMRIFGLGAKVMQRLGVETRALAAADIFPAMESGRIDAAEYSMPAVDLKLGLHEMAKHYYFPGWHQPATFFDLIVNLEKWKELSAARRARIEVVCGDNVRHGLAEGEAIQFAALKELQAAGVKIHMWPSKILEALEKAWQEVVEEEAAGDRDFRRAWKSLSAFREDYSIWKELGGR